MTTVRLLATFLFALAPALASAAGSIEKTPSCAASYKENQRAVNPENRWSYFKDTVREFTVATDGSAWVSFNKSSQRFQIAASEKSLLASAKAAFDKKTLVHVAVEESEEEMSPSPDPASKPSQLRWLDAQQQHPSCR